MAEPAITSSLNTDVDQLNKLLINDCPGEERKYRSVATAMSDGEAGQCPVEFLNSPELTHHSSSLYEKFFSMPDYVSVVQGSPRGGS